MSDKDMKGVPREWRGVHDSASTANLQLLRKAAATQTAKPAEAAQPSAPPPAKPPGK